MNELEMNVINVNTKQHLRLILLNINIQSTKEWDMNVTSMNIKPQIKIIQVNIKSPSMKELGSIKLLFSTSIPNMPWKELQKIAFESFHLNKPASKHYLPLTKLELNYS